MDKPIELTPRDKAAADYVNNTVFTDETGNDEVLVKNMRFMAFSAGADWGAKSERARLIKLAEELIDTMDGEDPYPNPDERCLLEVFVMRLGEKLAEE